MPYIRSQSLAGRGFSALSSPYHASAFRRTTQHTMSSKSPSQLWKPATGIRFSPKRASSHLYPELAKAKPIESLRSIGTDSTPVTTAHGIKAVIETSSSAPKVALANPSDPRSAGTATQQNAIKLAGTSSPPTSNWTFLAPGQTPQTNLDFKPSRRKYEAARKSAANSPASLWSHILYEKMMDDGSVQNVKVHYCTSKHTMENVCKRYFENESILGFDMEWMAYANRNSGPRQNVSLIQIASPGRIALFHIALFPKNDFVAPTFEKLMEDPNITKAGVNILADATRLRKVLGVNMAGVFEVSHLYNLVRCCRARQPGPVPKAAVAMGTQVKECLGLPISKEDSIRAGNWTSPLNSRQIHYAAADAYAGLQLFHVLEQHRLQLKPQPPRPQFAELRRPIIRPTEELEGSFSEDDFIDESVTDEDMMALEEAMIGDGLLPSRSASAGKSPKVQNLDQRLVAADASVQTFRALAPNRTARTAALRAYYVWHNNKNLTPAEVAGLLRSPPLQTNTVVTYILDVVTTEKLPYSKSRMAAEVLSFVHPSAVVGRYHELAQRCEFKPTE